MGNDKNVELFQSISDVLTPVISELATLGTCTTYSVTAIDHADHKIAFGCGSTLEEAEQ